jgi:hypothetical protein
MILRARDVVALQHFLLDAAKRYVVASGAQLDAADDLLASAAALDYALLLTSENGDAPFDPVAPATETLRETMARAAGAALDFAEKMLSAPAPARADFIERYAGSGGLFDVLRDLRQSGALASNGLSFRALTLASDLRERRC